MRESVDFPRDNNYLPAERMTQNLVARMVPSNPQSLRDRPEQAVPPFLLTMPSYGGTLAAARCLGQRGIPVTMAGAETMAPARWSKYVTRWEKCPPTIEVENFFEWLMAFGRRSPGHVLYPTCDDLAWLLADRAHLLSEYFYLYQPGSDAILRLLDKKSLHALAHEVGLKTLPTAFPRTAAEAGELGPTLGLPLLLKPRTQILFQTRSKGVFVDQSHDLVDEFSTYLKLNPAYPVLSARAPGVELPMLQVFRSDAAQSIYSISGFVGQGDHQISVRAAIKVLQRPRRLGVGLCFEEAPVDPQTLASLIELCSKVGYFGVFEAELIQMDGAYHLIDFNPRFYGQMGFEVARKVPLAYLVWLGALGRTAELDAELAKAEAFEAGKGYVYCNRLFFKVLLSLQRLGGRMTADEAQRWREWLHRSEERSLAFDSIASLDDPAPGRVSAATELYHALRHPRSFVRQMVIGP